MRVFLGLTEVSGHYRSLKQGLRELGISATFVNLSRHPFQFGGDDDLRIARWIRSVAGRRAEAAGLARVGWNCLELLLRLGLLAWAVVRFDVFIFSFNTSFLRFRDLPILKLLGKRVVYQFHGSDSRPPYLDGTVGTPGSALDVRLLADLTREKKRVLRRINRYADVVIDNPTGAHFHERPIVIWLRLGLPSLPAVASADLPSDEDRATVRVLHCPSNPVIKGTAVIEQVIARLRSRGHAIEFIQITGRPNEEVRRELARCDFAIDQVYSDYGMPGFATEAAWFGKPVVIAGYAADLWRELLPADLLPPTIFCHPDRLEQEVERLLTDRQRRRERGAAARQFVEQNWNPVEVARRYLRLLESEPPAEWLFDPRDTCYLHGCGASEQWLSEVVRQLVHAAGVEALQVDDKPELRSQLLAFSQSLRSTIGKAA